MNLSNDTPTRQIGYARVMPPDALEPRLPRQLAAEGYMRHVPAPAISCPKRCSKTGPAGDDSTLASH
jgi:hypothetical protein